jgi:carboxylesterase type B
MPSDASTRKNLPIFVWVHGGSDIVGSSTASGLNGAPFVLSQDVIVVIIQYRLGLFGWLQTEDVLDEINGGGSASSKVAGNQALRDVVMALQQIHAMAPLIGGSTSHIALMGQSSGAMMIRALLTTPSAQPFFTHAILASDTADYGLANKKDNSALGDYAMSQLNCSISDINCARKASAEDVLNASMAAYSQVPLDNPDISSGTPYRPMLGSYIPQSIEKGAKTNKPIIFTSLANEAGSIASYTYKASAVGALQLTSMYSGAGITLGTALDTVFNDGRGQTLATLSTAYPVSKYADGLRTTYETIVTDGLWRCATQNTAETLAKAGSHVWLAQWNVGSTYLSNVDADYCTEDGHVCHEVSGFRSVSVIRRATDRALF